MRGQRVILGLVEIYTDGDASDDSDSKKRADHNACDGAPGEVYEA
jgi:hypothetical protein